MTLVGTRVGHIRLIRLLGGGGMGEVYEGHDDALQRQVAVKVLRADRRLEPRARRRFLREARILSRVEHPNICRVLDFVQHEDTDFVVLELVPGITLDEAMDRGLSTEERWSIALQIADALQAAHAFSVVHRDLKPSNIMLTPEGVVKVLDFGLARTLGDGEDGASPAGEVALTGEAPAAGREVDNATLTRAGEILGTPTHMSPEQARGEPATAASDMYSLGLILHRLFTGHSPYAGGTGPQALLQKAMWGDTEPVTGVPRHLGELIASLEELSPADRPTAAACAARLRWIRDTPRRRLRRVAAAALAAGLAAATVVSSIGFVRARRAERRATAVNTFLLEMLASADPSHRGRQVRVVDVLGDAAARVDTTFAEHPLDRAAVLATLASTYDALGEYGTARSLVERSLEIRERRLGEDHPDTLATRDLLGVVLAHQGELGEAGTLLGTVVGERTRIHGGLAPPTVESRRHLAMVLEEQGHYAEARDRLERLRTGLDAAGPSRAAEAIAVRTELAHVMGRMGEDGAATALQRETLELATSVHGERHPETLTLMGDLAAGLSRSGHYEEAEALYRTTVDLRGEVLGPDHPDTLMALGGLGNVLVRLRRLDEAESTQRRVLETRTRVLGAGHPDTAAAMGNLAMVYAFQRRYDESADLFRQAWHTAEAALGPRHAQTLLWMGNLSTILLRSHHPEESLELARRVHAIDLEVLGPDHPNTLHAQTTVTDALWVLRRLDEAEPLYRDLVERSRRTLGEDHPATRLRKRHLARLLRATGRGAEADELDPPA